MSATMKWVCVGAALLVCAAGGAALAMWGSVHVLADVAAKAVGL